MSALRDIVSAAARQHGDCTAVVDAAGSTSYSELHTMSNRFAATLRRHGVRKGDRVGVWLNKSVQAVAAMQGTLRLGAAYVPLDPTGPALRALEIAKDCQMKAVVSTSERAASLQTCEAVVVDADTELDDESFEESTTEPDDLAYVLYTSGSTGKPKGVCISNRNALAFIQWATETVGVRSSDRLSNHAPFHFDLSVFDLYSAFSAGAAVHLVPEGMSYAPGRLVEFVRERDISVWYSVPSALILMMETGGLLGVRWPGPRLVIFAGEVFPITQLRRLASHWPEAAYFNFYGPTETNVCTFHQVTVADLEGTSSVPIGRACSGDQTWVASVSGDPVEPGTEGELWVDGPTVMLGYWGMEPQSGRPYATGDLVRETQSGYVYVGRRDTMVKVRGHRVELGEVESVLAEHPNVVEAAAVVVGSGTHAIIVGFLVPRNGRVSLVKAKQHCATRLPRYMIVDRVYSVDDLPRTANGKVDRRALLSLAQERLVK